MNYFCYFFPFPQYLQRQSENCLDVDGGLIEALSIKLRDHILPPDGSWFDSISKFVYEKLKVSDFYLILSIVTHFLRYHHLERGHLSEQILPKLGI